MLHVFGKSFLNEGLEYVCFSCFLGVKQVLGVGIMEQVLVGGLLLLGSNSW